ncbi:MAG: hypothetical protein MUF79_13280 [Burkholderiales bacterium]|nr:hypothetical protein [Burkholderiales bacterium]
MSSKKLITTTERSRSGRASRHAASRSRSSTSGSGASKASDPLGLAYLAGAQALERHEEHLLHEIGGRVPVAQMAQAV